MLFLNKKARLSLRCCVCNSLRKTGRPVDLLVRNVAGPGLSLLGVSLPSSSAAAAAAAATTTTFLLLPAAAAATTATSTSFVVAAVLPFLVVAVAASSVVLLERARWVHRDLRR